MLIIAQRKQTTGIFTPHKKNYVHKLHSSGVKYEEATLDKAVYATTIITYQLNRTGSASQI